MAGLAGLLGGYGSDDEEEDVSDQQKGAVDPVIADRVADVLDRQQATGLSVMAAMRNNRRWNNPAFLKKMVDYYHLHQYGAAAAGAKKSKWDQ
eukprot:gene11920-12064_t